MRLRKGSVLCMKNEKRWIRTRHRVIEFIFRPILAALCKALYRIDIQKFPRAKERAYIILSNHQTDFDQFFVTCAFRKPIYYVAMEDIFSLGFLSKIISWAVAPIPIQKGVSDIRAALNCIAIARQGGSIAVFPEGNRTYSGKTCYIKPSVASLVRSSGLPLAIFRIENGYGVKPRWADRARGGSMRAGVTRVIEPEEIKAMSNDELYRLIVSALDVNECETAGQYPSPYSAEYIERVLYVCPDCGLTQFESHGETFFCRKCAKTYRYGSDKRLSAAKGLPPFPHLAAWYDFQEEYIRRLDLTPYLSQPAYRETASLSEVIVFKKKMPILKGAVISLYGDRLEINLRDRTMCLPFEEIKGMACIANHKLNIFHKDRIYQLRGNPGFNALKYCNFYYHAKYIKENHADGVFQFLGL